MIANELPANALNATLYGKLHSQASQQRSKKLSFNTAFNKHALTLGAVVLSHVGAIILLAMRTTEQLPAPKPAVPMMVSLIAPPAEKLVQKPVPKPELLPIIEQAKPIILPKPKLLVEKIRPVDVLTQRLIEATTEPILQAKSIAAATPTPSIETTKAEPKIELKATPLVEEKIEPPRFGVSYLNNPAPDYPPLSRRLNEEGRVLMKVLVSAEGSATEVLIEKSSGSERLNSAAIAAVMRWRFIPATKNNQPLSAYVLVPMKFSLTN